MYFSARTAVSILLYISTCFGQCPENWTLVNDDCLNFHPEKNTWSHAKLTCKSELGHLVTPSTRIRDLNLKGFLQVLNYDRTIWVDGKYHKNDDFWYWTFSNETMTYSNWDAGRPDSVDDQSCVAVVHGDGHWRNKKCGFQYAFVCETKAHPIHGGIIG